MMQNVHNFRIINLKCLGNPECSAQLGNHKAISCVRRSKQSIRKFYCI